MSRGELAMVLFLFLLIWGAGLLPRLGERLGAHLAAKRAQRPPNDAAGG